MVRGTTRMGLSAGVGTEPERDNRAFEYPADQSIGFLMRITLRDLRNAVKARLAQEGIPWSVWFYLRVLWEEDGLTQGELTRRVGMMQPTTVNALRSMERLGLVTLERDRSDRRKLVVRLTSHGRNLKARLLPDIQRLNDEVALHGFSEGERGELRRLLTKMKGNLSAARAEPGRPQSAMDDG